MKDDNDLAVCLRNFFQEYDKAHQDQPRLERDSFEFEHLLECWLKMRENEGLITEIPYGYQNELKLFYLAFQLASLHGSIFSLALEHKHYDKFYWNDDKNKSEYEIKTKLRTIERIIRESYTEVDFLLGAMKLYRRNKETALALERERDAQDE